MAKVTKEPMPPIAGPHMVRHDAFLEQHQTKESKHHKHQFKKHAAGHEHEMDRVARMCGGGKVK